MAQLNKQNNRCAICEEVLTVPCIDHCHDEARTFRGVLCRHCNTGIGMLKDNPEIMLRAAEYVRNKGRIEFKTEAA